ncbi:MAG: hypothetical protein JXR86_18970 [Spirochaetales bacterium]|nr:hypothetical protein [Spirochaetales bacterium]
MDFGSGPTTRIHVSIAKKLREYYGLDRVPVKVTEPYQMLGEVDDELKNILNIETDQVSSLNGMFGFPNSNWKEWKAPWGQVVLVPGQFFRRNVSICYR